MTLKTKKDIVSAFKQNEKEVIQRIQELIKNYISSVDFTYEEREELAMYQSIFDWEQDFAINSWWRVTCSDIGSTIETTDENEARAYLLGKKNFVEPDPYDVNVDSCVSIDKFLGRDYSIKISELTIQERYFQRVKK